MMRRRRLPLMRSPALSSLTSTTLLAWTMLLAFVGEARADAIVRTNGTRIDDVQVTVARWDQISYEKGGTSLTVPGEQVLTIERSDPLISRVRRPLESGDHAAAWDAHRAALSSAQGWQAAELAYLKGKILLESGRAEPAAEAFSEFIEAHKAAKDFWIPHAIYGRARAMLAMKHGGTAAELFKELDTYGSTWALRSVLGQAEGALLEKDWNKARQLFSRVASDRQAPPELVVTAKVGRLEVLVGQEQYDAAIDDLKKTFFDAPGEAELAYTRARARATYLLGLCYEKKGDKPNLERAEIWYLRTAVLYATYPEVYRDAAGALARVYQALGRADRAQDWAAKAKA